MKIIWKLCLTYEDARNYTGIIYLHEWNDKPFYWGKADKSYFGGHKRICNENKISGRYNVGYRHWIEGCLKHGAKLYIGILDEEALKSISMIENYMIDKYPSEMNKKKLQPVQLAIVHAGDVPASIILDK
ncbi:hypothetical protein [Spirosoma fluviale]|uniref:GIY-YIG domain-containing protein n=1 Tax=Spirosoma fluviale TaxID=1597977 RepID=A0A286FZA2_9BACT|nr:hypothetical protein [Spirosoma fluviale]SOD88522.1 hypothetical protein SAMN06269250_2709 [Spirosoma fluviale]